MPILELTTEAGTLTINVRRESTLVMLNGDTAVTFEYEGRRIGAFLDGRNYRRSLANDMLEKQSGPRPGLSGRLRRLLSHGEVKRLEERAYAFVRDASQVVIAAQIAAAESYRDTTDFRAALQAFERVQTYNYDRLEAEREVFSR